MHNREKIEKRNQNFDAKNSRSQNGWKKCASREKIVAGKLVWTIIFQNWKRVKNQ